MTGWKVGGIALFCVSAFLLLTMGGAIVAAPVTIPLLFVVADRYATRAFRVTGSLLVGATCAEFVWALTYVAVGEAKPWIWLLPLVAGIAAMTALCSRNRPPRPAPLRPHADGVAP
jgi:hypothetical protein